MLMDPGICYYGCVPNVGDVLSHWVLTDLNGHFLVVHRHFIHAQGNDCGWALIVEEIKDDRSNAMLAEWAYDTKAFSEAEVYEPTQSPSVEAAEHLDRSNRDPAYWTFERKELLRKEREARLAAIQAEEDAKKR